MKTVTMSDTIYNIVLTEPKLQAVLVSLGFKPMANQQTLNTIGRMMTLQKASDHIGLDINTLKTAFENEGVFINE